MERKASKAKSLVRVELGCGGLLGLGVVAFCIFLWMYLFGVWTGQSGLQSTLATGDPRELVSAAAKMMKGNAPAAVTPGDAGEAGGDESQTPAPASTPASASTQASPAAPASAPASTPEPVAASAKPSPSTPASNPPPPATKSGEQAKDDNAASFFAVQIGAFRDEQRALKAVAQWRVRSYEAFYLQPEAEGNFYRVLVGHFDSLAEANGLAAKLEASEQNKVFISLVSEGQKRYPVSQ